MDISLNNDTINTRSDNTTVAGDDNSTTGSSFNLSGDWKNGVGGGGAGEGYSGGGGNGSLELMPEYAKVIVCFLYGSVVFVAIGGNLIVCCIVMTQKRMRTVTNYFIASLACSDILMASLCIPFTFVSNVLVHYWPFASLLCPLVLYAQVVSVFLSAFTMLAISIDRYRAVIYPLKPRLTTGISVVIIVLTWALALSVSLPVAVFSRTYTRADFEGDGGGGSVEYCDEVWPSEQQRYVYSISVMILQYFLPLSILSFTYINIGVVVWVKKVPGEAENNRDRRLAASKRKMVKMMITVVVIYAVCWLPIHAITLIGDSHPDVWRFRHIQSVWIGCHWLAMSSCCYNPIVYCWMNPKFRNGFHYIFRFCPCVHYDPTSSMSGPMSKGSVHCSYVTTLATTVAGPGPIGGEQAAAAAAKRLSLAERCGGGWTTAGSREGRKSDAGVGGGSGAGRVLPFWERMDQRRRTSGVGGGGGGARSAEERESLSLRDIRQKHRRRFTDQSVGGGTSESRFCSDSDC